MLPPREVTGVVVLLKTKLPGDLLLIRLVDVEVQPVQYRQSLLGVPMLMRNH